MKEELSRREFQGLELSNDDFHKTKEEKVANKHFLRNANDRYEEENLTPSSYLKQLVHERPREISLWGDTRIFLINSNQLGLGSKIEILSFILGNRQSNPVFYPVVRANWQEVLEKGDWVSLELRFNKSITNEEIVEVGKNLKDIKEAKEVNHEFGRIICINMKEAKKEGTI